VSLVAKNVFAAALFAATAMSSTAVNAETLFGALSKAYQLNSTLNYSRAGVRVTDENVPIAKSGFRPTIGASGNIDYTSSERTLGSARLTTGSFGVQIDQMLFDGFQTRNNVRAADRPAR
jgi:outer membrane protein